MRCTNLGAFIVSSHACHKCILKGSYQGAGTAMTIASIDFQMLANAGFPPARYAAGDVIFAEGDKGDTMFVVRTGEVAIERGGRVMETLGGGGVFGEMALIDGSRAKRHGPGQNGLRSRPHQQEDLPLPRARDAVLRHCRDAYACRQIAAHGRRRLAAGCALSARAIFGLLFAAPPAMIGRSLNP